MGIADALYHTSIETSHDISCIYAVADPHIFIFRVMGKGRRKQSYLIMLDEFAVYTVSMLLEGAAWSTHGKWLMREQSLGSCFILPQTQS